MATPIIVNQSTTLVQVDTSVLLAPYIVLLSNLNSPGSLLTIRDSTGNASLTNNIIISTTVGVKYLDGGGINSNIYTINQPYGFLTVTPKTTNIWGVTNTFAFPDASASANLNLINVSSMNVSTIGYIQRANISTALISTLCTVNVFIQNNLSVGESTIAHAGFYTCSIRSLQDIIGASDIYAGSTLSSMFANITSTLTVPFISTQNVFVYGGLQTTSSISTSGPMFVGSSISTTGNLAVGASTFIQGQLTVLQAAFFNSSISTKGALNVGFETILNSSLTVGSVSTLSNMTVCGSLSVMSTLYTRWNAFHESSILASGSFSTLEDVNIRRNLSTLGNVFIDREVFTRSSMLITGAISTLHDINVRSNVSILGNLYVKGDVVFDDLQVNLQDIMASSLYTQYNISTMSSLIAGGFLHVNGSTLLRGTVCTLSNFNIRGLLSTASSIIVGDSLNVFNTGFFGSNISTPSSIGVGDRLTVGGATILQGFLSTFGQSAFFSSMQIQGSLSVMSSIAISCNLDVGNSLTTRNMSLTGSTFISTLAVTNTIDFGLNISSSTLHHGLFSTSGAMNIGGLISTTNALIVGSTINTQLLSVRSGMSVFSDAGFAQDIYARSSIIIGMSTIMRGALFTQSPAYLANALFTSNVVLGIPDLTGDSPVSFTNNGSAYIKGNLTVNTGILQLSNVLQIAAGTLVDGKQQVTTTNLISNDTVMSNLSVIGLTAMLNTSTTGTLNVRGLTTLSNTSTIGTFTVTDLTTLSNTSTIGTLNVTGLTTFSSNIGIFTDSSGAQLDIRGGDSNTGIGSGGSNMISFQYATGGFRHFIRTRHMNQVNVNTNAIDFWLNNSSTSNGSSTAGTNNVNSVSMTALGLEVNGTTRLNGSMYIKTDSIHYSDDNKQRFFYVLNKETRFGSGDGYLFQDSSSNTIVRIDNSGNIAAVSFSGPGGGPASFPYGISGTITLANTDNSGRLNVGGATILSNTLDVSGVTTLSNTLRVGGATTLSNTLDVSGVTILRGNLGINCTPGASTRLDIQNVGTSPLISLQNSTGGFRHFITSQHSGALQANNSINFWLNTAVAFDGSTAPALGNLQIMSLTPPGIGINTSSIRALLDIKGGRNTNGQSVTAIAFQSDSLIGGSTGGLRHFITTRHNNTGTINNSNAIDFWLNRSTDVSPSVSVIAGTNNVNSLSVTAAGIGINCNAPNVLYSLDVSGTINCTQILQGGAALTTGIAGINSTGRIGINKSADSAIPFDVSGQTRFSGNVGIFTNTSEAQLDIRGGRTTSSTDRNQIAFQFKDGGFRHFITSRHNAIGANDTGNSIDFWLNNSSSADTSTRGGEGNRNSLSVTAAGIGIFKPDPAYQLDVSGTINFTFKNDAVYKSTDNKNRLWFDTDGPTNFGTNNSYVFRGSTNEDLFTIANTGSVRTYGNVGILADAPFAPLEIRGGRNIYDGSSNLIAFQFKDGGFRHFITSRHHGCNANYNGNSIDFWLNNSDSESFSTRGGVGNINTLSVTAAGIGIFKDNPGQALDVVGNIRYTGTSQQNSDKRYKENIVTIDSALDKVTSMRGVYYTKKDSSNRHVGVIAQEMEGILPEVVHTDSSEEKMKSVSYGNITAVLIEAIKEQQGIINAQQSTINGILYKFSNFQP
jgi:hypothetical protein